MELARKSGPDTPGRGPTSTISTQPFCSKSSRLRDSGLALAALRRFSQQFVTHLLSNTALERLKYTSGDIDDNITLAKEIEGKYGKGIAAYTGSVVDTPPSALREHFEVNTTGILILFQALTVLLRKSATPKFIPISSAAASLTAYIDLPVGYICYGVSKVVLNYIARKIHFENDWLGKYVYCGLDGTLIKIICSAGTIVARANREMNKTGSLAPIQDMIAMEPEDAALRVTNIVDGSTREKDGGEFINVDGSKIPW
ncbi:hypothetical protein DFS33DRAFT_1275081 [Desarmillaria ectypa]|nr:hypothetical protein DFS33DRAFT_1275081 [Desarmillaria ectypa]